MMVLKQGDFGPPSPPPQVPGKCLKIFLVITTGVGAIGM